VDLIVSVPAGVGWVMAGEEAHRVIAGDVAVVPAGSHAGLAGRGRAAGGAQRVSLRDPCPVDAIYPEDEVPAEWASFIKINADYFKKERV
jgi:hypothetical protein